MTEQEYYRIAGACDRLLRHPDATLEWMAIPWLHVVCQHPVVVAEYEDVVEELRVGGPREQTRRGLRRSLRQGRESTYRLLGVARNLLRAVAGYGLRRKHIEVSTRPPVDRADVVIVSWLVNVDHLEMIDDFYFGDLQSRLDRRGLSSLLVLRNQTSAAATGLVEHARREGPCARMILADLVDVPTEVGFFRRCAQARRMLRYAEREASSGVDRRVAREARLRVVSNSTMVNLRLHAQIADLCRRTEPSVVMTLYEGNAWERCVWHAAKTAPIPALCVGYQHTILWQHAAAIRRSLGPSKRCDPDLILTVGDVTRQILGASQELRAMRIVTFGTHRRAGSATLADAPRFAPTFLVVPEGVESECIYLFEFALECARRLPQARFIFRTHPVLPFETIESKLSGYRPTPGNIEVSRGRAIEDDFARAGYLLYRGSSTVIYGVLAGLKPFYITRPGEMNIDPLYALSDWREYVCSVEDLIARYASSQARGGDGTEEWQQARAFCDRYMRPIREDAVDEMVNLASKTSLKGFMRTVPVDGAR